MPLVNLSGPGSRLYASGGAAESFDYYIGPSGSDSNNGLTTSTPWALTALNNSTKRTLYAGKRVGLLDGTYNIITLFGQPTNTFTENTVEIKGGSSSAAPTVIKAVNRWGAIIDGQKSILSSTAECGLMGPLDANVTIDGLKYTGGNYSMIAVYNKDDVIIQNCWLTDQIFSQGGTNKNSSTIYATGVARLKVRNCLIERCGAPADNDRHDYILIYGDASGDSTDCIVEYNTVRDCSLGGGNCVYTKRAGGESHNNIVRYNYFDRSDYVGSGTNDTLLWSTSETASDHDQVIGNVLVSEPGRAPMRLVSPGNSGILTFDSNICVGNWADDGGLIAWIADPDLAMLNFSKNIMNPTTSVGFRGVIQYRTTSQLGTLDYNWYRSASPNCTFRNSSGTTTTGLSNWQTLTSKEANSQAGTNPGLLGSGGGVGQYRPDTGGTTKTMGPGGTEIGAWTATGIDSYGPGYSASRS